MAAAAVVVAAIVLAERAGAFYGSLIISLPISTGPAYVFVALDHDSKFVSLAALTSLANNVPTILYIVVLTTLAHKSSAALVIAGGLLVWLTFTILLTSTTWSLLPAIAVNVCSSRVFCPTSFSRRAYASIASKLRGPSAACLAMFRT